MNTRLLFTSYRCAICETVTPRINVCATIRRFSSSDHRRRTHCRPPIDLVPYPPYNIEKTGDFEYRISLAVAGFAEAELEIEAREGVLTVTGRQGKEQEKERQFHDPGCKRRCKSRPR